MTEPVTLHNLSYLIDTNAWLDQRTGAHQSEHTSPLQDFVRCDVFDECRTSTDMAGRLRLWCVAHGYPVGDGAVIEHDGFLSEPVTIVLATTTGIRRHALALVSINGASPNVYADRTSDGRSWQDAATLALSCARGHMWTWDGGRYLRTARGVEAHISRLFGLNRCVISRCRDCEAFDDGATEAACPCPGFAVYCPACGDRCQLTLPEIPTLEEN
jgi:hypothetical protein